MHRHEIDNILATYRGPLAGDSAVLLGDTEEMEYRASVMAGADAAEAANDQRLTCDAENCRYARCEERAWDDEYRTSAAFYEGIPPSDLMRRWDLFQAQRDGAR